MKKFEIEVIVFDFDGVLAESVDVKGEAFYKLYEHEGEDIARKVLDHHLANGGVSRYDKIRHYESEFLDRTVSEAQVMEIAQRFSDLVEEQVVAARWVNGAKEFLDEYHSQVPLYVASATPQEELDRIVSKRGMAKYFKGVFGSPARKADHLIALARTYDPKKMLMIGDTISDYKAAQAAGTLFLGREIDGKNEPFPPGTVLVPDMAPLKDFIALR